MRYSVAGRTITVAMGLLLCLAGCGKLTALLCPPEWRAETAAFFEKSPEAQDVLNYFLSLREMSHEQLVQEYNTVLKRFEKNGVDTDRWHLICITLLPGQPYSDSERALALLQGPWESGKRAEKKNSGLLDLLRILLSQQRDLELQLAEQQARGETLENQLEELKAIEKILSERERMRLPGSEISK